MDKMRTKILISLSSLPDGYRPIGDGALQKKVDQVVQYLEEKPKAAQDAVIALFEGLCKVEPNKIAGSGWKSRLDVWIGISGGKAVKPAGGMTLAEMKAMNERRNAEAEEGANESGGGEAPHSEIIAKSGYEAPDESAPPDPEPDIHSKIIAEAHR